MDCLENENVCSVQKENNKGYYRLHTIWKTNGFSINIMSKDGAWHGEMNQSDIEKISNLLEMDASSYLSECRKALTTHDGLNKMSYVVENGCFEWKKIIDEDQGVKRKMGFIKVEPTDFNDSIQNFITVALKCNKKLQAELSKNQEILQKNCEEKQKLVNKLDELINTKNIMENDLYSKFILLLNSKKSKIKELKNRLNDEKHKNVVKKKENANLPNPYEIDTDSDDSSTKSNSIILNKRLGKAFKCDKTKTKQKKNENKEGKEKMWTQPNENEMVAPKIRNDSINCSNEIMFNKTANTYDMTEENELPSTQEDILNYFYGSQ